MVRMQMGQEDLLNLRNGKAGLGQLTRHAIAGIHQIMFAIDTQQAGRLRS